MKLADLAQLAATLDLAGFQVKFPDPALVFLSPLARPVGDLKEVLAAATSPSIRVSDIKQTQRVDLKPLVLSDDWKKTAQVLFLRPRFDPAEGITLGRALGNDYSLPVPSVSKSHVTFTRGSAGWKVTDLASSNGTFVDGMRLAANDTAQILDGSLIGFGPEISARFFVPAGFYKFLTTDR
jgi:hypothetical protein